MLLHEFGYTVHYAFHNRSLEVDHYQEQICKFGFPVERVYSNDDNELKLTEDDKNDWHGF